ncbi:MAG TPA: PAS domain S-box protein [Candidatus Limnocylindrales bacterium]|nr:PAS domain S-box protein [Candidatus Limnocylindrales bacterium]
MSAPPADPIDLLIVEDDAPDAELIVAALERAGVVLRVDVVDRLEEVRRRLASGGLEVIIADYQLREWRGTEVLGLVRELGLDIPVIMVTGSMGEEFADVCLREGAADFVLKHRLGRLAPAVKRAVDLKRTQRERAAALERVRMLSVAIDQGPAAVFVTDTMGRIEYVNRRFTEITGYSPEEALGQNPRILRSGKTPPEMYERLWSTVREGRPWRSEILNRRKSGDLYWSHVSISPVRDQDGVVKRFVAVHEDVSERRWAEEAIREREERLRQIAENIHEVFWVVAADYSEMLYISPAYEEVWGRSCRSLYEDPSSFMNAIHPEDRPHVIGYITRLRAGEDPGGVEFRVTQPSGQERWVHAHAAGVLDERGEVYRISGVALDITQKRRAEDRLRESELRFRYLTEATWDVVVVSSEGIIREVNKGFERHLGYPPEEVVGRPILDFIAEDSREVVDQRVQNGVEGSYEASLVHKDGRHRLMEITAKSHALEGTPGRITALRDVTERRALESQLRQSQKLEAVGRLAGGVAHDFNNVLTVILSEIQLLQLGGEPDAGTLAQSLKEIELAAKRAAGLTRQLLTFSRRDVVRPEVLDPVEALEGLQSMLRRVIGEDVSMDVVRGETGNIRIDRGHLEQVIVNLAVNARDAMPEGGKLRIEVRNVELDEAYAESHPEARAGRYVMIAVSDSGTGMSREVQEKLFEPFFTTKPAGKGTGLGLATSYGIVKDGGGHFGVYSELGVGTTMKVYLPVVDEGAATKAPEAAQEDEGRPVRGTVLVVEDDEGVRRSAVRALERMGCTVLSADGPEEALDLLEGGGHRPDLIFTDVIMPGMTGPELAWRIRELMPDARVLFTTGYTSDMAFRHQLLDDRADVLTKPYTLGELARRVRSLLSA